MHFIQLSRYAFLYKPPAVIADASIKISYHILQVFGQSALPRSRETAMTVSDKKYDCTTCPYPRYKDGHIIFCDVCIRKILDEQREKKQRKEQPNE